MLTLAERIARNKKRSTGYSQFTFSQKPIAKRRHMRGRDRNTDDNHWERTYSLICALYAAAGSDGT